MVISVLPSWQHIYCLLSSSFLISASIPLLSCGHTHLHSSHQLSTQLQGPVLADRSVTTVHMRPRSAVGAASRETHQMELHTAGKPVPLKAQGSLPVTALIQKPAENVSGSNLASRALGLITSLGFLALLRGNMGTSTVILFWLCTTIHVAFLSRSKHRAPEGYLHWVWKKTSLVCFGLFVCFFCFVLLGFLLVWGWFFLFVCTTLVPHPFWLKTKLLTFGYTSDPWAFYCLLNGFSERHSNTKTLVGRVQDGVRRPCERE